MDVVTTYLYGNLDMLLYISPPPDFFPKLPTPIPEKFVGLRICKALYGLKQASKMFTLTQMHIHIDSKLAISNCCRICE